MLSVIAYKGFIDKGQPSRVVVAINVLNLIVVPLCPGRAFAWTIYKKGEKALTRIKNPE